MRKNVLCACLSLALLLALASPVRAAGDEFLPPPDDGTVQDQQFPEDLPDEEPDSRIRVSLSASDRIIVNPYRLSVRTEDGGETRDTIVHQARALTNHSSVPVLVDASVVGTAWGEASFVSAPPAAYDGKCVFLYAEFQERPGAWSGWFTDAPNQLLVTEYGSAKENVMWLDAGGEGYYRLFGEASVPSEGFWSEADTVDATFVFTFTALQMPEDPSGDEPLEVPENPDGDEPPETPEEPGGEELPELPETPGEVEEPPELPENPGETEEPPETPENPGGEDSPEVPENPGEEDLPEVPENPGEEDSPEVPENPGEEEPPEVPENPGGEEPPETPEESGAEVE